MAYTEIEQIKEIEDKIRSAKEKQELDNRERLEQTHFEGEALIKKMAADANKDNEAKMEVLKEEVKGEVFKLEQETEEILANIDEHVRYNFRDAFRLIYKELIRG
jgi:hypothetical protein